MKKYYFLSILIFFFSTACKKINLQSYSGEWELESVVVTDYDTLTLDVLSTNTMNLTGRLILNKDSSFVATSATGLLSKGSWGVKTTGKLAVLYFWKGASKDKDDSYKNLDRNRTVTKKTMNKLQYATYKRTNSGYLLQETIYNFKLKEKTKDKGAIDSGCNGLSFSPANGGRKCMEIYKATLESYNSTADVFSMMFSMSGASIGINLISPKGENIIGEYPYSASGVPNDGKHFSLVMLNETGGSINMQASNTPAIQITSFQDDGVSYVVKGKANSINFQENSELLGGTKMNNVEFDFIVAK